MSAIKSPKSTLACLHSLCESRPLAACGTKPGDRRRARSSALLPARALPMHRLAVPARDASPTVLGPALHAAAGPVAAVKQSAPAAGGDGAATDTPAFWELAAKIIAVNIGSLLAVHGHSCRNTCLPRCVQDATACAAATASCCVYTYRWLTSHCPQLLRVKMPGLDDRLTLTLRA